MAWRSVAAGGGEAGRSGAPLSREKSLSQCVACYRGLGPNFRKTRPAEASSQQPADRQVGAAVGAACSTAAGGAGWGGVGWGGAGWGGAWRGVAGRGGVRCGISAGA